MKEMQERDKNILKIIIALLVFVLFMGGSLIGKYIDAKKIQKESQKTVLVTDESRYITVINCAKKFLNYVQNDNKADILLLLEDGYKDSFRITENNIKNFIPVLNKNYLYDYKGEEMYQKRISEKVIEYYVKGKIKASQMDEPPTFTNYDLTVVLYEDKFLFSIKPGIGGLNLEED